MRVYTSEPHWCPRHARRDLLINANGYVDVVLPRWFYCCMANENNWGIDFLVEGLDDGVHTIQISVSESYVLDWVLTAHSWDPEVIGRLRSASMQDLRLRIGRVPAGHTNELVLNDEEVDQLLVLVPVLFMVGTEEVGSSVKKKLYECLIGEKRDASDARSNETTPQDGSFAEG
jgi:hypothetical protein